MISISDFLDAPTTLLLLGIMLGIWAMLRLTGRRLARNRRKTDRRPASLPGKALEESFRASKVTDQLEVRLHDAFREMNARIDTKIRVLNELLIESELRIAELRALGKSKHARDPKSATSRSDDTPASADAGDGIDAGGGDDAPLVVDVDGPRSAGAGAGGSEGAFDRIYELADDGFSAPEIGERLEKPTGEIELILGLRRRRAQAAERAGQG